jgi:hypothetical protein
VKIRCGRAPYWAVLEVKITRAEGDRFASRREVRRNEPAKLVAYIVPRPSDVVCWFPGGPVMPALWMSRSIGLSPQFEAKARTEAREEVSRVRMWTRLESPQASMIWEAASRALEAVRQAR